MEWEAFQKSSDFPVLVKEFRAETVREITEFFCSQHCQTTTEYSLAQQSIILTICQPYVLPTELYLKMKKQKYQRKKTSEFFEVCIRCTHPFVDKTEQQLQVS